MGDLTIEKLHLFLLAILPGIVAIKTYDLFYPPEKRDFGSSLLEAAVYGLLNLAIWAWPVWTLNRKEVVDGHTVWFPEQHPVWYSILSLGFLVISPAVLAYAGVRLRNCRFVTKHIGYPTRTAWDDHFKRGQECWVLFHLKSGKMLGGYFGEKSYATTFPQEAEILVEEVWRVNETGEFVEKVEGTLGSVIRQAECERLEFLQVEAEQCPQNETPQTLTSEQARSQTSTEAIPSSENGDTERFKPLQVRLLERLRRVVPERLLPKVKENEIVWPDVNDWFSQWRMKNGQERKTNSV